MPPIDQLPGYDIVSRIGRGAGAVIYLAQEAATRREVAVKQVVRKSPADDRFITQAETEYEVAHNLDHANLRHYYDIHRERRWFRTQQLFLIMEYVDGLRLEDKPPQDLLVAVDLFLQIAAGLDAMHMAGFAHADIKPNNILLTREGGLKIIDFGQSCPLGHVKERVQGTPDYIAPEQVLCRQIDQRTDVFNLGATMYWVVSGKYFKTMIQNVQTGTKRIEIDAKRGSGPPHESNERVPLALSRLIMDCCETQPDKRPRDMRQVTSRLETVRHLMERKQEQMR